MSYIDTMYGIVLRKKSYNIQIIALFVFPRYGK